MTYDDTAARAEAERRWPREHLGYSKPAPDNCRCDECYWSERLVDAGVEMARWQAEQEPTEAELRLADYQAGRWCGECRYGIVEDPPCCTQPRTLPTEDEVAEVIAAHLGWMGLGTYATARAVLALFTAKEG